MQGEGGKPALPVRAREASGVLGPSLDPLLKKQHGHTGDCLSKTDDSGLETSVMLGQK